ncbi:MAG: CDP-diacylglycerol--glycerol-3-phosphate 3-phosphatidyltransferase [Halodesulfovibrio sp.]
MFNLANKITIARILIVPFIVLLMYFPGKISGLIAFFLFFVASATDMLDGFIARREGQVTSFGKFLDPLADKLLISSVLIMLTYHEWVPAWITIVIICRELIVTGLRAMAADEGIVIAADRYGKIKTILQMFACAPLIIHEPLFGIPMQPIGEILLYIALVLTVFSGGNYLYGFYGNWLRETAKG